jgi:hypothetical protein
MEPNKVMDMREENPAVNADQTSVAVPEVICLGEYSISALYLLLKTKIK